MIDSYRFNVRDEFERLLCPACGYPNYTEVPAYDERGGLIGTTMCRCCLWEPGFDDDPCASPKAKDTIVGSLQAYRAGWGPVLQWRGRTHDKPLGWVGAQHLTCLFEFAPLLE